MKVYTVFLLDFLCLLYVKAKKVIPLVKVQLRHPIKIPSTLPIITELNDWKDWFIQADQSNYQTPRPPFVVPVVQNASLPIFVVAGVQKGGTTFLRALMGKHPMLSSGKGMTGKCYGENHFFDLSSKEIGSKLLMKYGCSIPVNGGNSTAPPTKMPSAECLNTMAQAARAYSHYHFHFPTCEGLNQSPSNGIPVQHVYFFDTTPKYILGTGSEIASPTDENRPICSTFLAMKAILAPKTPIVLLLRNPVQRYRSGLAMSQCTTRRRALIGAGTTNQHSSFVETWHTDWIDDDADDGQFSALALARRIRARALLQEDPPPSTNTAAPQNSSKRQRSKYHNRFGDAQSGSMRRYIVEYSNLEKARWHSGLSAQDMNKRQGEMKTFWPLLRSRYSLLIRRLLKVFPLEQLYVIRSEDMFSDAIKTADMLSERVGLPPANFQPADVEDLTRSQFSAPCAVETMMDDADIELLHRFLVERGDMNLTELLGIPMEWGYDKV